VEEFHAFPTQHSNPRSTIRNHKPKMVLPGLKSIGTPFFSLNHSFPTFPSFSFFFSFARQHQPFVLLSNIMQLNFSELFSSVSSSRN
jgi:hypothetical protein